MLWIRSLKWQKVEIFKYSTKNCTQRQYLSKYRYSVLPVLSVVMLHCKSVCFLNELLNGGRLTEWQADRIIRASNEINDVQQNEPWHHWHRKWSCSWEPTREYRHSHQQTNSTAKILLLLKHVTTFSSSPTERVNVSIRFYLTNITADTFWGKTPNYLYYHNEEMIMNKPGNSQKCWLSNVTYEDDW